MSTLEAETLHHIRIMDHLNLRNELENVRNELEKIKKEKEMLMIFHKELEETNNHLVAATWRERDMKKQLAETLAELNNTKVIVEAQNKRIAESINYSQKIQTAINPEEEELKSILKDSFILYKPKDIISGDFPWLCRHGKFLYLAAVDCTGHGVPGAMMSMIGSLLLNDIVNNQDEISPSQILFKLHHAVVKTLKQDVLGSNSRDGMDIALCRLNLETNELMFSGAHRPLIYFRNNEIHQVKADKYPIGGVQYKGKNEYTDFTMQMQKNDSFFIFSDGLTDQIGGNEGKKFMINNIREIIQENAYLTMETFKYIINQKFEKWKGPNKQIDDVILIGFKI
jgi:serine phosphatase RsbU (regulator of sigma subunit)